MLARRAAGSTASGSHDDFFELGGDSLLALALLARIRRRFVRELPARMLLAEPTVAALARALGSDRGAPGPLVALGSGTAGPPLFLVPGAGGTLFAYRELARRLGNTHACYGLQPPGIDGSGATPDRVEDLAAAYVDAVLAVEPRGPYLLAGHSFGATIALEMAQQLLRRGAPIGLLAVLDAPCPDPAAPVLAERDDARWRADIAAALEAYLGRSSAVGRPPAARDADRTPADDAARHEPRGAQARRVLERLTGTDVVADEASELLVGAILDVYRASARALAHYAPSPYPHPITLLRAQDAPDLAGDDATLGWSTLSPHPVTIATIPGDHVTMLAEPHVEALAGAMRDALAAARSAACA